MFPLINQRRINRVVKMGLVILKGWSTNCISLSEDIEFFIEAIKAVNPATICLSASEGQEAINLLSSILNENELRNYIFLDIVAAPKIQWLIPMVKML